jgi:uncharacterized membrane protein YdcZ (DUF606 family)
MNQSTFNTRIARLLQLPAWLAGISFSIGTLLLLLYLGAKDDLIMGIGFMYLAFTSFVNASVFGALVICSFFLRNTKELF